MIKAENIEVWGFEHAIRGMRNPLNSWDRIDSGYFKMNGEYYIGENDLELMRKLYHAGTEHRKYLRQIFVSMDITAPLYWQKEMDTYKVGTVANSCSTMHKIAAKEFELDDFSHEHLLEGGYQDSFGTLARIESESILGCIIGYLNYLRERYNYTKDKTYWWQIIQLLPSSYNQRRTVTMNYENVVNIINQRSEHKLDEWREFCEVLRGLPYVKEIIKK